MIRTQQLPQVTGQHKRAIRNPEPTSEDSFGEAVCISADGSTLVVGAPNDDAGATDAGSAYVFDADTGALRHILRNPEPTSYDWFGTSIAVSSDGHIIAVAANQDDFGVSGAGSVYIFDGITGAYLRALRNPESTANDGFGSDIAMSGDGTVLAIGTPYDDYGATDAGSIYIFNAITGSHLRTIRHPTPRINGNLGSVIALSLDGTRLIAGDPGATSGGALYAGLIYVFNATTGSYLFTINSPDAVQWNNLGNGLAISTDGSRIVSGSAHEPYGRIYVFDGSGVLLRSIDDPDSATTDDFGGWGVAMSADGNTVLTGNPFLVVDGVDTVGCAYKFNAITGALMARLPNPEPTESDYFSGIALSGDGSKAIAVSYYDDYLVSLSGSVYCF